MDPVEKIFGADEPSVAAGDVRKDAGENAISIVGERDGDGDIQHAAPVPGPMMTSLASFVMSAWRTNWEARNASNVTERLDYARNANACSYTEAQKAKMVAAGVDPRAYAPVTFVKNRSAKAMLLELVNSSSDPLFSIEPSPDPFAPRRIMERATENALSELREALGEIQAAGVENVTPEIQQNLADAMEAAISGSYDSIKEEETAWSRRMAKRMERRVWDVMVEGGWKDAFMRTIGYTCIYGTGVMIGPVMRTDAVNECVEGGDGVRKYRVAYRTRPVFEAVDPYDCYPAPDAEEVDDGPLCIRVRYNAADLWRMSTAKGGTKMKDGGWIESAVNEILNRHPNGGVKLWSEPEDSTKREIEGKEQGDARDCTFEGVRCFAPVRGSMLAEMGVTKIPGSGKVDMRTYYRAEMIVIDNVVVFCRVYDERLGVPVCRTKFYETHGSWWGESIADKLYMAQYAQNNLVKAIMRNMAVASGPQFWIGDASRLVNKNDIQFRPLKTWMFGQSMIGNQGAPMGVLDVPFKGIELINVFKEFRTQADIDSGIPAYTDGQSAAQGGALRTSSGLAMYMESANRGMKMVIVYFDRDCICRSARMVADWLLVNDDDMDIKGDVTVVPVGLIGRILKAQRDQLRQQLLSMVLNSQYLQQLLGPKAVLTLFRPAVRDVDVNPDDVVPNEERTKEIEMLEKIKQVVAAMGGAQQAPTAEEMGGAPPGVAQPAQVEAPGGVSERQGVA